MTLHEFLEDSYNGNRAALARDLGVSRWAVCRYLDNDRAPDPEVVEKIFQLSDGRVQPNDFYPTIRKAIARRARRRR